VTTRVVGTSIGTRWNRREVSAFWTKETPVMTEGNEMEESDGGEMEPCTAPQSGPSGRGVPREVG
jgi:hypothetical protein